MLRFDGGEGMMRATIAGFLAAAMLVTGAARVYAGSAEEEIAALRSEVAKLREAVNANRAAQNASISSAVDTMMDNKYGPDAAVTTRAGKLTVSGLVQVWYYSIQNDTQGLFHNPA